MKFLLEKIDLEKIKQIYLLRGYRKEEDDSYRMSMVLIGDTQNEFELKLLQSIKVLSISDGKDLLKYLRETGLKIIAEVLKADFERFYNTKSFEKINV